MKQRKHGGGLWLLAVVPIAACSTLVGADFDGLAPLDSAAGNSGSPASGGVAGASVNAAGKTGTAGEGGSSSQAGNTSAGSTTGGTSTAGEGGAPNGGADPGGAGNAGESAAGAGGVGEVTVPPSAVLLNELKGQGSGDDYIELFNPGDEPANISGCYVADDSNNRVTFPAGATIGAKSYVLVRLQQASSTGMAISCFGFSPCYAGIAWGIAASGELVFLYDSKGVLLDQLTYPDEAGPNGVGDTHAFGRIPDGASTTGAIVTSPGATNNAVP